MKWCSLSLIRQLPSLKFPKTNSPTIRELTLVSSSPFPWSGMMAALKALLLIELNIRLIDSQLKEAPVILIISILLKSRLFLV